MSKTEPPKKTKPRMDFSGLDDLTLTALGTGAGLSAAKPAADVTPAAAASSGEPLQLAIDRVIEDPAQPRKHFDQDALDELAGSIRATGIKSPISVKPANAEGLYVLNFGARRLRAAKAAGLATVPAFIDATHEYWDQAAENLQREDFTIMEKVAIVKHGLDEGLSQADICKKLNKSKTYVSKLAALAKIPAFLVEATEAGRIESHDALYDLATFLKKNADEEEEVRAFVAVEGIITRQAVLTFIDSYKTPQKPIQAPSSSAAAPEIPKTESTPQEATEAAPAAPKVSTSKLSTPDSEGEGGILVPRFTEPQEPSHQRPVTSDAEQERLAEQHNVDEFYRDAHREEAPEGRGANSGERQKPKGDAGKDSIHSGFDQEKGERSEKEPPEFTITPTTDPVLMFRHGSRGGSVNLRVTVDYGFVMVRYDGEDQDERVKAGDIEVVALLGE